MAVTLSNDEKKALDDIFNSLQAHDNCFKRFRKLIAGLKNFVQFYTKKYLFTTNL